MDAVKFLEEYKRMCDSFENCSDCSLLTEDCNNFKNPEFVEKVVPVVEEWAASHPRKTRQSVFLEHYPNAKVREGVLAICPQAVEGDSYNNTCHYGYKTCDGCRKTYWHAPIAEKKGRRDE